MTHPGQKIRLILFDALAPPASVAQLPPVKLAPHELEVHRHSGGQTGYPGDQRLPVGLSGGYKSQHVG
jgi:hypothetical protein